MEVIYNDERLTLKNFERRINSTILQRGRKYYNDGAVLSIEEDGGNWTAEVEGSDYYEVTVSILSNEEIGNYYCDCPYDGDTCKHVVAVLFAIREEIDTPDYQPQNKKEPNQFEALLSKISVDEYQAFVKQFAVKNKDFKTAFELFFADKDDRVNVVEKYGELVLKVFKKFAPQGFIEYRSSTGFAKEIGKFIGDAYSLIKKGAYKNAFAIASALMKEVVEISLSADDSNGSIGEIIFEVVELIEAIITDEETSIDVKEDIFKFIDIELHKSHYFDGDLGYNLFDIFEELAGQLDRNALLLDFIDAELRKQGDTYTQDFFLRKKISLLENASKTEEAEILLKENLHVKALRQQQVDKAINKNDFTGAKALIAGGIEIANTENKIGTVIDWEKELLRIAKLENDIAMIRQYCKRFAIDQRMFDKTYYNQWKKTYGAGEWNGIIEEVIKQKKHEAESDHKKDKWSTLNDKLLSWLAPFYIEEQHWDRLFALVKNETGLDRLLQYHTYLHWHYPTELLEMYLPALEAYADRTHDRSGYAALVGKMEMILQDIPSGKDQITMLVKNFKIKYARRPAMIDELNKL